MTIYKIQIDLISCTFFFSLDNCTHILLPQMVEEESNPAVSMEHANISAFMDALQSAGYHIGTGNQQIIINADGNAMVVDQQVGITGCFLINVIIIIDSLLLSRKLYNIVS